MDETASYDYYPDGNIQKVTQPDGSWLHFTYDTAHRLIGVDDNAGNAIDYDLNSMGSRKKEETYNSASVLTRKVRREFDALNRLYKDIAANDAFTTYTYDGVGNLKTTTQPASLGRPATSSLYDTLNRLSQTTAADGGVVKHEYDGLDQLTKVTDPRNLVTNYAIGGLGNQTALASPDTETTNFTNYDAAGNLKTATDARNKTVNYLYDALNRVQSATYVDQTITYTYDQGVNGIGRLTRIVDSSGQTDFAYDAAGRLKSDTRLIGAVSITTQYGYDASGRLGSITYPSGRKVTYGYDTVGRIAAANVVVGAVTTPLVSSATYQPFGGLKSFSFGASGPAFTRSYDLDGRITSYKNSPSLSDASLAYDDANGVTMIFGAGTRLSTEYDLAGRLGGELVQGCDEVCEPAFSQPHRGYDTVGNRGIEYATTIGIGDLPDSAVYVYGTINNRLMRVEHHVPPLGLKTGGGGGGSVTIMRQFAYDNTGNLTSDGDVTYAYDDRGRMKTATSLSGSTTYSVNGLGQRVKKVVGANTTLFAYDQQGHTIGEYDAAGAALKEHVWLGDTPISVLLTQGGSFTPYYVWADHLNTPRIVTNTAGAPRWTWSQESAFGANAPSADPSGLGPFDYNLRFPGQYFDAETGTHYNYFRDYDPRIGRYIESDPIGLKGGIATYAYVKGSPLSNADPTGLFVKPNGPGGARMSCHLAKETEKGWSIGFFAIFPMILFKSECEYKCMLMDCWSLPEKFVNEQQNIFRPVCVPSFTTED